jgi:DNA-binding response OmpR family regulator
VIMPPRILVADDDAWILRMVTTVLKKRGYEVDTAPDGEQAYERALSNPPDLLITDVMMPNVDGWTLVKRMREHPVLRDVPVIFLTALSSDDDRIHGFRLGADDYLPKPFRFEWRGPCDARCRRRRRPRSRSPRHRRRPITRSTTRPVGSRPRWPAISARSACPCC